MKQKKILLFALCLICLTILLLTACGASATAQDSEKPATVKQAAAKSASTASSDRYSDQKDIGAAYQDAVSAMTEQNVLQGYDDGKFHPTLTLTREQGAKIVTYLMLGAAEADTLTCETAPYKDVVPERWSAAPIAWCTEHQILDGYGDGNYGPADPLTGQQFAKMLLCAYELGTFSPQTEGADRYLGDQWAELVSADGTACGLFYGDESMNSGAPFQRQQAALMADNARKAKENQSTPAVSDPSGNQAGNGGSSAGNSVSSGETAHNHNSSSSGQHSSGDSSASEDSEADGSSSTDTETAEIDISPEPDGDPSSGAPEETSQISDEPGDTSPDLTVDSNGDTMLPEVS